MRGYKILLVVGSVFLAGVIAWRLFSTSYSHDVRAICDAEARSGAVFAKEPTKVVNWMKSNVDSPQGVALVTDLQQKRKGDGAAELAGEAKKVNVAPCALADAFAETQADRDYKSDLARFCSGLEFPNLETLSDDDRMARLKDWVAKQAKSPKTAAFVRELEQLPANERGKRMRDEAAANDKFMCEVGSTLDKPQSALKGAGPQVRYHDPQIIGPAKQPAVDKAVQIALPKIKKCYTDALAKKPDLQGRIVVKLTPTDKGSAKAVPGPVSFPDPGVAQCVIGALDGTPFDVEGTAAVVVFVPIDFTPN